MNETDKIEILARWKETKETLSTWKSNAREDYDFVASRQWTQEDLSRLQEEQRPALTFNRAEVFVDAVVGNEINSRMEAKYLPRGLEPDAKVAEIVNAASKWVRDKCNATHEENDAFRDTVISGIGVIETRMDYEDDPEGMVLKNRVDPIMYWWDPAAKKQCLEDRRYDFHGEWVDKDTAKVLWPEAEFASTDIWQDNQPGNSDARTFYDGDDERTPRKKNQVLILKYECWKKAAYYKVIDPETSKVTEMEAEKFKSANARYKKMTGNELQNVKLTKKVYYRAFLAGEELLEYTKSPVQCFTRQVITGKRDRNRNEWYGIVRVMKDPQKWANKFLSQILNIIASNAKGGVMFESGAFADQRKAEEQWATPSPMIETTEGALSQQKIKERVAPPIPAGLERLMMFSYDSMPFVTGINLEALGLADRQQAGVLEAQRRKAAFGILAPLFESLRRFRKNDGYVTFKFIREFIADGRLIRIVGDTGDPKYVPLLKDYATWDYDITVDEAPESPDFKEKTWETMSQLLPTMMKIGYPIPPEIWSFSPLPTSVSTKMIEEVKKGPQIPEQVKQKMQEMEQGLQKLGEENAQLKEQVLIAKVDKEVEVMKVQQRASEGQAKIAQKYQEADQTSYVNNLNAMVAAAAKQFEATLNAKVKVMIEGMKQDSAKTKASVDLVKIASDRKADEAKKKAEESVSKVAESVKAVKEDADKKIKALEEKVKKKPKKVKRTKDGFEINDGESTTTIKRLPDGYEITQA